MNRVVARKTHWCPNSNTLATWCEEPTHWKRPWCWERLKAGGEGDDRGWDGWMASPTQWTWVWASSGRRWWTGKPGMLRSTGSQRVGYDLRTTHHQQFSSCPGLQWWLSAKESARQRRRRGFNRWTGKMPYALVKLSRFSTATEPTFYSPDPQLLKPMRPGVCAPQQEKPLKWEALTPQLESRAYSLQLERSPKQWWRLSTAINTSNSSI